MYALRVLSDDVSKDDVVRFLNESRNAVTPGDRNNIDAVLQASVTANFDQALFISVPVPS